MLKLGLVLLMAAAVTRSVFPVEVEALVCASAIIDPPEPLAICEDVDPMTLEDELVLFGTACYYADYFEGRRTANGERFRQRGFTAAHRSLALGTVIDVESVATGRRIRLRVNDRGPFSGGFEIDLSKRAAQFLGIDSQPDRRVRIRIVALPEQAEMFETGPVEDLEDDSEIIESNE